MEYLSTWISCGRGGISMSELRQTLAAGGYSVTKNNRKLSVLTKRLVHNQTVERTTRSATFSLNKKVNLTRTQKRTALSCQQLSKINYSLKYF